MAVQRRPNMFASLVLFVGGTFLAYYIFQSNGWHSGVSPSDIWKGLPRSTRAIAVGGFIASAYGFGGILNNLLTKKATGLQDQ
jgi:hypothetical protein